MTQTEMGEVLGTTQYMISKVESGSKVMSPLMLKILWLFSQSVSLNRMFAKEFDEQDDTILDKQFAINSFVKAKLELLKEELITNFDNNKNEMCKQLDEASKLL
jgi:toxin-antitoxin system, antitoxin component, xre family